MTELSPTAQVYAITDVAIDCPATAQRWGRPPKPPPPAGAITQVPPCAAAIPYGEPLPRL